MEIIHCFFFLLALPIFLLILLQKSNISLLPPGPPRFPLLGNLHLLNNSAPHRLFWQLSKKYGSLMYLQLGSVPTLIISSAKMAEEVMRNQDLNFCSRPSLLGMQKLSYNGLDVAFAPYGAYWRKMRRICVVHLFHSKQARAFRPVRETEVAHMIQKISEAAEDCRSINLSEFIMALTTTTITCRIGFGKRYADEGIERSRFHSMLNETEAMFTLFCFSDYFRFMGWADKWIGSKTRLEKNFKECDQFYQELIDEHLDSNRPKPEQEDIVDVLIRLKEEQSELEITLDHIKAVLMNVFVAGSDTSAGVVVWAMTALMKNPEAMKRVQDEVRNVVGDDKTLVDEDHLEKLPYLKAVVKETFRTNPISPLLFARATIRSCDINGYHIPANTLVFVNAYAIGRDPEAWENPEEFCPDRFIGSSVDFRGNDYKLVPFGAGRRVCPGIDLGVPVVELALANLVRKFDWGMPAGSKVEDIDMETMPGIVMHKKNPLRLMPKNYI